jgi:hypothetical protein
VIHEILWALRCSMLAQVARSADDDEPKGVRQPDCDHVALDEFVEADAGVVALRDDVDEAVLEDKLDVDARITVRETSAIAAR